MISSNRRRVTPLCAVVGVAAAQIMALFCVLLFPLGSSSQQPSDQKAKQAPSGMGVATGEAHPARSEEHTSELQSLTNLVCRLLLEKKKKNNIARKAHTSIK